MIIIDQVQIVEVVELLEDLNVDQLANNLEDIDFVEKFDVFQ
jgi:Mg/Co/Ni transporter MgtE